MLFMLIRRVLLGGVTVCIVSLIIFAGVEMLPGDACTQFLGEYQADEELLAQCRKDLDLNRPPIDRFAEWTQGAITGDLGLAADGTTKISTIVGDRLKNSLLLAFCAMAVGIPLALLLGVISGLWRDRLPDIIASTLAIFAMTIPEFVSATLLILVFSVWLGWLPGIVLTSAAAPASEFFPEILLPVIVLSFVMCAHIMRMVRSSVIDVMASDYVQMATLKGVPYWQMVFRHALPNALLPAINVVALTIAWLLGGVVVIEVVFNYPGLGRLMIDSISDRNLPVVQSIALIVASVYVCVNLAADLLTMIANPKLRTMYMRK